MIQEVIKVKYLGVVIDQRLTRNYYIKQIACKATKVNAFLSRNLYQCPPIIKSNVYKAMVRPILECSSTIWDPHTSVNIRSCTKICSTNMLQRFSRYSSVSAMLVNFNPPLFRDTQKINNRRNTTATITSRQYSREVVSLSCRVHRVSNFRQQIHVIK